MASPPNANTPGNIPKSSKGRYRPEIDGLRAFAVVAVIINHFNKNLLPSGYLGVDIFFVISGYVITSSLSGRQSKNFLDFLTGFYERRIKRLVPALAVFLISLSILICMTNPNPGRYLQAGVYSLFGMSNIFLYRDSTNYFAQSTELNPFTHTWSLGVEEQFYLLFPFLIWFSGFGRQAPRGARNLFFWIGAMTVASLTSFIYLYQVNQPAAYFLMPPRFWEMAAGCLIFIGFQRRARIEQALEQVPPLLIVAAMVGVMFLPISAAVPATISIVVLSAILISCLKNGTAAFRFFSHEKVVFIGLISYSLYLWHWGVLVISRWTIGIHLWSAPFQLLLMVLLATLSYKYIETPFRLAKTKRPLVAILVGVIALCLSAVSMLAINSMRRSLFLGDRQVFDDNRLYRTLQLKGDSRRRLLVFGDSHAGAIGSLLENLNEKNNFSIIMHARGVGIANANTDNNNDFINKPLEQYASSLSPNDTILIVLNYQHSNPQESPDFSAIENAAEMARLKGARLILFRPIPYFNNLRPYIECYQSWFRPFARDQTNCVASKRRSEFTSQFANIIDNQNRIAAKYRGTVYIYDPFSILCPIGSKYCTSQDKKGNLFKDSNHISSRASLKLKGSLLELLER